MEKKIEIAELIARQIVSGDELTVAERSALDRWLAESDDNRRSYARWRRMAVECADMDGGTHDADHRRMWRHIARQTRPSTRRRTIVRRAAAAAVVVALAGAGWLAGLWPARDAGPEQSLAIAGERRAVLTLDDGREIALGGDTTLTVENTTVAVADGRITHLPETSPGARSNHVTLSVPRGMRWSIELSDGSRVQLNSGSKLRYPLEFDGPRREVELDGEACFEVRHDAGRPFTVRSGAMRTTVLGTVFNVCAYAADPFIRTTLLSGAVDVTVEGVEGSLVLEPATQAIWSEGAAGIEVRRVNVEAETAWLRGVAMLDETSLGEIMNIISRWYDVDVEYRDDTVAAQTFTGRIDSRDDLRAILDKLTMLGAPRFETEGGRVIVVGD